jgi:hypothetical protein
MRDIKEELEKARNEIRRLDAEFTERVKKEFALSKEGLRRRAEDGKGWEELLKSMPVDLSKLQEHEKADAKKAAAILKELEPRLRIVPKEALLQTQERLRLDDLLNAEVAAYDGGPTWHSLNQAYDGNGTVDFYQSTDSGGVVQGSCGDIVLGSGYPPIYGMYPRAYAQGSGSGWQDFNEVSTKCWLWFYIPGAYVTRPGTLYVWPYFDVHGYYRVRANDGFWTSKEAEIKLTMSTVLYRYNFQYASWFSWVVRDRGNDNIDEEGRVDYSGYHNDAKGVLHVLTGEDVFVQVIAELKTYVEGSGSQALLDFQTGENNWIRIPRVVFYTP